jgi:spore maturation protein CgeB
MTLEKGNNLMKVLMFGTEWIGGIYNSFIKGFIKNGWKVDTVFFETESRWVEKHRIPTQIQAIIPVKRKLFLQACDRFNKKILKYLSENETDIIFLINEDYVYPETLRIAKSKYNCKVVCWVADDPFNAARFKWFPAVINESTHLYVAEKVWLGHLKILNSKAKYEILHAAVDDDIFKPSVVTPEDREKFKSEVAFVGSSYNGAAPGLYRASIINDITEAKVNLWGDSDWCKYYSYYPNIKKYHIAEPLPLEKTNILNQVATITLNISHPQLFTAPQLRTFEIPSSGGFQIADKRSEIDLLFEKKLIPQFTNTKELNEIIRYFLHNENERNSIAAEAQKITMAKHTFKHRCEFIKATI